MRIFIIYELLLKAIHRAPENNVILRDVKIICLAHRFNREL